MRRSIIMNIYLAAPWVRRDEARTAAAHLNSMGHHVVSRWLWLHGDSTEKRVLAVEAQNDLDDVDASDVLVLLNLEKSEGKAVETGYAIAKGKPVIVVSGSEHPHTNIFHHLPSMIVVQTIDDAVRELTRLSGVN